jgi:DNA invertase Pin-like site-specific DNA recombinase
LANCEAALPDGWEITAWFWDIESGRTALERRGRSRAHEHLDIDVPRDGGLPELLAEAEHPHRRFDAVICESIDRLARRTYVGTRIEHDLEQVGVRLYAADEPIDPRGKRSTGLLTRRVKQGVAEWYVTDMLERSWRRRALQAQIDDLTARQDRLITELETTDPTDRAFRDRLHRRFDTLEAGRADATAELHDLNAAASRSQPDQDPSLLDALPILQGIRITDAPEPLQRKLYDALQLQIHYDRPDQARVRLVLTDDTARAVTGLATAGAHQDRTPPGARHRTRPVAGLLAPA